MPEPDTTAFKNRQSDARISLAAESARWDRAFESERLRQDVPHPAVVDFFEKQLAEVDGRILDLGCGFGRHMVYFAGHGRHSHGIDLSPIALAGAADRLSEADVQSPRLARAEFGHLPFANDSIAGGVSIQAIYHGTRQRVLAALHEVQRVLRNDGLMLISFLSDRSDYFGHGTKIEAKTYRLHGGVDSGAPHHFQNQLDLEDLCQQAGLVVKLLQLEESILDDGQRVSHWFAVVQKQKE